MTRMCMPDSACRAVDIESSGRTPTASYVTGRDGTFAVTNPAHERRLRQLGAFPANLGGTLIGVGYPCRTCGFGSLFRRCSRCGTDNPRQEAA